MVPGYVQGGTRVPPDQPEGGGRGTLYLGCLWWIPNIQHPTTNIQHPTSNIEWPAARGSGQELCGTLAFRSNPGWSGDQRWGEPGSERGSGPPSKLHIHVRLPAPTPCYECDFA